MTFPTLAVEVSFTTDPLDTPVWVAITEFVASIKTKAGRSRELEPFVPGTLTLQLDNADRRFDPFHATGPYYGDLKPNRRVRVRATYDAVTYDVWTGFIDGWPQSYSTPGETKITVTATDAFKLLAKTKLPDSVYALEVLADTPWQWFRFKEKTGGQWLDHSGNDNHIDLVGDSSNVDFGPDLLPDAGASCYVSSGIATIPATMTIGSPLSWEFWFKGESQNFTTFSPWEGLERIYVGAGAGGTSDRQRVFVYWSYPGSGLYTDDLVVWDGDLHHIVVTRSGGTVHIYVDGVDQAVTTFGSVPFLGSGTHYLMTGDGMGGAGAPTNYHKVWYTAEFAIYPSVLSAARVLAHYNAGVTPWNGDTTDTRVQSILDLISWPAALADIAAGDNACGIAKFKGKKALSYLQMIEDTEQGQMYCNHRDGGKLRFVNRQSRLTATRSTTAQYVFSDDDADATAFRYDSLDLAYDERDIRNKVSVKWVEGVEEISDSTSITENGEVEETVETEMGTAAEARALGEWVLNRYKDPAVRCRSIQLDPAKRDDGSFVPVLEAKINDKVTVRRLPYNTGAELERDVLIEGIEHEIDNGVNTWRTTFRCSETDAGPWFTWGGAAGTGWADGKWGY